MTTTTRRSAEGQRPVYGEHGKPIATISPTRSTWLGSLLAECTHGHIYVVPDDWLATDAVCPRCKLLGLA